MTDSTAGEDHAARPNPLGRLVDLTVFAPVGLVAGWKDQLPAYIRQGRQAVENRVIVARWIGQMAVQQGQRELAKRLEAQRQQRRLAESDAVAPNETVQETRADLDVGELPATTEVPLDVRAEVPADVRPEAEAATVTEEVPHAGDLPIDGYESLAALQVVQRLGSLDAVELELVRRFEAANRARRTILAKIAQLQGEGE